MSPHQLYGNDLHGNHAELCWHCEEHSLASFHCFLSITTHTAEREEGTLNLPPQTQTHRLSVFLVILKSPQSFQDGDHEHFTEKTLDQTFWVFAFSNNELILRLCCQHAKSLMAYQTQKHCTAASTLVITATTILSCVSTIMTPINLLYAAYLKLHVCADASQSSYNLRWG